MTSYTKTEEDRKQSLEEARRKELLVKAALATGLLCIGLLCVAVTVYGTRLQ